MRSAIYSAVWWTTMATSAESLRARRPTIRSITRRLGTLLILAGVLGLVWAATVTLWQDPFTSLYALRAQRQLSSAYDKRVRELQPTLTTPAVRVVPLATVARRYRKATPSGAAVGRLRIPEMGLTTVVVQGTDSQSLKKGPGIDERTHMPGEGELVYIAGHRTTYLAPFSHIGRLDRGDTVQLSTPYATFDYRVTEHVIVPASDIDRLKSRGREELALQACHPRFFANERYIVYARLVAVHRLGES
jgi:sortase A